MNTDALKRAGYGAVRCPPIVKGMARRKKALSLRIDVLVTLWILLSRHSVAEDHSYRQEYSSVTATELFR